MVFIRFSGVILALLLGFPASAQTDTSKIWLTWERIRPNKELCQKKNLCRPISHYVTRLFEEPSAQRARSIIGSLDTLAAKRGRPVSTEKPPKICQNVNAIKILGFDPESWPLSKKLDALRGIKGVHFNLRKLKPPVGFVGDFGGGLQAVVEQKFQRAGLRVLSKAEMEKTPGQPRLNIYFSNTNLETGCHFSVFASFSQTVLLTRNHTVKLRAGTWGMSGGFSADFPDRGEFDAILVVVDKLLADYRKANGKQPRDSG
jgi:hypothetical protein